MLIRELDLTGKKLSKAEYKSLVPRANHSIESAMEEIAHLARPVSAKTAPLPLFSQSVVAFANSHNRETFIQRTVGHVPARRRSN